MERIFVTGGSGFVGQNIIPMLITAGYEVSALARSEQSAAKVSALGAIPIQDDLTALSMNTRRALQSCDYVLHAAAHMDFAFDPKPYYTINVDATHHLLSMAKEVGVSKFIYISAAPVVPGSPIVNLTEVEAGAALPKDLYPKTKAIAEKTVLAANTKQFKTIALRPPAIWGPNNHHYEDLLANVKNGKWRWLGGGEQILSTVHVRNLGNAILSAIQSDVGGQAYFITDGNRQSMKSFFKSLLNAEGLEPGDKTMPLWVANTMAQGIAFIWQMLGIKSRPPIAPLMIRLMGKEFSVSDAKARRELGYRNIVSMEDGLAEIRDANR